MRADYTVDQDPSAYGEAEHDRWRRLYRRQIELVPGRACDEYVAALRSLPYDEGVPRFDEVNAALGAATGWRLVAVPGLVPDLVFFDHLANRRFPVTWWLREEHEFDYIVEPDVFHDFFGHVPMLFTPLFADYMQAYGRGGLKAEGLGALRWLARLYWYTVEFGLIRTPRRPAQLRRRHPLVAGRDRPRACTARSRAASRFDLRRIMRSRYRIDAFQETYFVIDGFEQLFEATAPDFTPLYRELAALPGAGRRRGAARTTGWSLLSGRFRATVRLGLRPRATGGRHAADLVAPRPRHRRPPRSRPPSRQRRT